MFHTTAWLAWLLSGVVPALLITNPLYLVLLMGAALVNYGVLGRRSALDAAWRPFIKIGLALVILTTLFNLLFAHSGRTVLFVLPAWQWLVGPDRRIALVSLGGPVALEAVVFGLTRAVALIGVILMFATFNILVDTSHLLRSLPRFMYQTGVVTSIAVTFVPQTMMALKEIREAQAVRGHRFRGVRDLLPLFLPLLTTGLERAVQLSESMEARGFGSRQAGSTRQDLTYRAAVLGALVLAVAAMGLWGFGRGMRWLAVPLAVLVVGVMAAVFRSMGRRVQRSRYRRERWRQRDTWLAAVSVAALALFLAATRFDEAHVYFYPYPQVTWPGFNPAVGVLLCAFVTPVLLIGGPAAKGNRKPGTRAVKADDTL